MWGLIKNKGVSANGLSCLLILNQVVSLVVSVLASNFSGAREIGYKPHGYVPIDEKVFR